MCPSAANPWGCYHCSLFSMKYHSNAGVLVKNASGILAGHLLPRSQFQHARHVTNRCAPSSSNNVSNEPLLQSVNESVEGTSQGTMSTRVGTTSVSAQSLITWDTGEHDFLTSNFECVVHRGVLLALKEFYMSNNQCMLQGASSRRGFGRFPLRFVMRNDMC